MFLDFFLLLRKHALPVTLPEYLTLLSALRSDVGSTNVEDFYYLSKTALIKHEQHLDLFDRLFGEYIAGRQSTPLGSLPDVPPDWLKDAINDQLTNEDRVDLDAAGGLDALWQQFRELLDEQNARNENGPMFGGSRWIGTDGTSPFGTNGGGSSPEGFNLDTGEKSPSGGNRSASKVWEQRDYKNLDDSIELNTRNLKMALRRLRILTREGVEDELDIDGTIDSTSRNAGMLDIQMQPSRKNRVKVLMLFDVGGSMDEHIELCSHLFSAARYQFKHLEFMYFHNCVYETLWKDNLRRRERVPTWEVLHKYNKDYKVIFVGDAAMSPYEITMAKGSVEHYNEEAGIVWLGRFKAQYPNLVWLNPNVAAYWKYTQSTSLIREWSGNRMFPLTLNGLEQAMKSLKNPKITF
ncbi:vWA domain-containing protein [Spirosoma endbachense]|uniref:VWA domain-containing protein n=1 Tax=Spirosoma endbachense TaxID=2666025 RepID=A0A6P1W4C2_9BACT|nr:VWA domain-containing protein [Spirosoma endbachense]QHV99172.1 VWA domain-containing protein [Spirosoma endbachense]